MRADRLNPGYIAAFIILASAVAATASFIVPLAPNVHDTTYAHWRLAISAVMAVTTIGSSLLFLRGIRGLTTQLRRTYILLATAVILFGLAVLQIPIIALHEWWRSWYVNSGIVIVPFIASTATLYISMRTFALLLGKQSRLTSRTFANGAAITVGLIAGIMAHFFVTYDLEGTDLYISVTAFTSAYIAWAALLALHSTRIIGSMYRRAMAALTVALLALAASGWHEVLRTFFVNDGDWYVDSGVYLLPFAVSGVLLVCAGYLFSMLQSDTRHGAQADTTNEKTAYINGVLWAASLASRPADIASVIDIIRIVTSHIDPDATTLTAGQKDQLLHIYETLEEYLTNQDPLKRHTREEVRDGLAITFREAVEHMPSHHQSL